MRAGAGVRVRSCKEWMRRFLLAFPLHHVDAGADFDVGHVQAELITKHRPELGFVAQVPPFCLARRVPKLNMVIRVLLGPGRAAIMLL